MYDEITREVAIKGFVGATLFSADKDKTTHLLEKGMGLEFIGQEGDYLRYRSRAEFGNIIDLKVKSSGKGTMGVGTGHHIAWRATDDHEQLEWSKRMTDRAYIVTKDRYRK